MIKIFAITALVLALSLCAAIAYSHWEARRLTAAAPNPGELIDVGGFSMNSVLVPAGPSADLPTIVFVHGASGNMLDQMTPFRPLLEGRAQLLFLDRPGHGFSERGGPENAWPDGQADAIARLMEKRGIGKAIIVGHSFAGAVIASFALRHPDMVEGLVFLSPATHPWPGGITWYYALASKPVVGWLFSHAIATPVGMLIADRIAGAVFAPNKPPADYVQKTAPQLVLRPDTFRSNAIDIDNLLDYVTRTATRYPEIKAPTVIITGDSDDIVLADIHSRGLARDIEGSELVWIAHLGHKPDYMATDVAVAAIEKVAGRDRDLQMLARRAEARLADETVTASMK